MLPELVQSLTTDQNRELIARGIPSSRLSEWRHGRRLPSINQLPDLAAVTGVTFEELAAELATLNAPEAQRDRIKALVGKLTAAGVAAMLAICGVVGAASYVGGNALFLPRRKPR